MKQPIRRFITAAAFLGLGLAALAFPSIAIGDVSVVQKGYFEVMAGDQVVSQHATYRKSLEAAINHNALEVRILAPEIVVTKDERDVVLSWEQPTSRADGEAMQPEELAGYRLYVKRDGDPVQEVETDQESLVVSVPAGSWSFEVSAVDTDGLESARSDRRAIDDLGVVSPGIAE